MGQLKPCSGRQGSVGFKSSSLELSGQTLSWLRDFGTSLTSRNLSVFLCEMGTVTEIPLQGGSEIEADVCVARAEPGTQVLR